jgi:hypothetical protein
VAGNWLKRINAGDKFPFSAAFHNATADVLEAYAKTGSFGKNNLRFAEGSQTRVRVRNDTGGNRTTFDVIQLSDPIFTPTDNEQEYKVNASFKAIAVTADTEKYAVLLESLPQNDYGWAMVAGCGVARVNFASATIEDNETAKAGSTADYFEESDSGSVHVVWREGIAGEQWAWVCFKGAGNAVTQIPAGECSCCGGCVCYPTDPTKITSGCGAIGCLLTDYKVVSTELPFSIDNDLTYDSGCDYLSNDGDLVLCSTQNYGSHHWKLTVGAGAGDSTLDLVNLGTGPGIPLKYVSAHPFLAFCGNEFVRKEDCGLYADDYLKSVSRTWPSKVCVNPVGSTDCVACELPPVKVCGCNLDSNATVTFSAGGCAALSGMTVNIVANPASSPATWSGDFFLAGCGTLTFSLQITPDCNVYMFIKNSSGTLKWGDDFVPGGVLIDCAVSPTGFTYTLSDINTCATPMFSCTGNMTATVTLTVV